MPIALSLLQYLPLPPSLSSRVFARLIDPPVFGSHHAVPFLGLGFVPARGQALFVACLWILNIALAAVAYPPSATPPELVALVGHRVGLLSLANLALAVLYASRNSLLLHLTDWSHATFLLLHRWTAVIGILQAGLHSALYLRTYHDAALGYAAVAQKGCLIWGVATLAAMGVLVPASALPFRRRAYEVFLVAHVVLSALALVGGGLHILYRYGWRWEYQAWIAAAFGIWGFDRLLARPARIWRNGGLRPARVSVVDPDYLMVEVPGVAADGHAYLYFPSLSWRVWENHPFSVAAPSRPIRTVSFRPDSDSDAPSPGSGEKSGRSWAGAGTGGGSGAPPAPGIVFFVRCRGGLTTELRKRTGHRQGVRVLVESSYGFATSLIPRCGRGSCSKYPNLVCIAGGVGITAMLPLIQSDSASSGTTELYWGVRSAPLVEAVARVAGQEAVDLGIATNMLWGHARVSILVGMRLDLRSVLEDAVGRASGGTAVAVCGPPGMADEVRSIVAGLGKRGLAVKLREESFVC